MDSALIVRWSVPVPGRERRALELAAESNDFWGKQAADGRCTVPEWFFAPDGAGTWIVRGERNVLEVLAFNGQGRTILAKGQLLLQDWTVVLAMTGRGAEQEMATWAAAGEELGLL